jgi:hypothetical protein
MHFVKFGLLSAVAIAAVACGGGAAPTPAGATATPAGGTPAATAAATPATTPGGQPGQGACHLVTQAEMDTVFGGTVTIVEEEDGGCNVTPPNSFIPVNIRYGVDESIAVARDIVDNDEDLTIGGNPALYGELFGGILYVEKGGQTLVLQSPLSTELRDKMIAVAEIAITRFP